MAGTHLLRPPRNAGRSGKTDTVKMPTSGQCHLAKKATPRDGNDSRGGVSRRSLRLRSEDSGSGVVIVGATLAAYVVVGRVRSFDSGRGRGGIRADAIHMQWEWQVRKRVGPSTFVTHHDNRSNASRARRTSVVGS
jgi:hypothetical protein